MGEFIGYAVAGAALFAAGFFACFLAIKKWEGWQ
jgi:hypothetical protein